MTLEMLEMRHAVPFLKLIADFAGNDQATFDHLFGGRKWDTKAFHRFAAQCAKDRRDWRPKAGQVSLTHYLLLHEEEACGYGRMRFPLDEESERKGGNLEFYVPPAKRGQGYGTLTLNRMLFEAARAGLARALVTCDFDDGAARICIEKNRGELIEGDGKSSTARFWLRLR